MSQTSRRGFIQGIGAAGAAALMPVRIRTRRNAAVKDGEVGVCTLLLQLFNGNDPVSEKTPTRCMFWPTSGRSFAIKSVDPVVIEADAHTVVTGERLFTSNGEIYRFKDFSPITLCDGDSLETTWDIKG